MRMKLNGVEEQINTNQKKKKSMTRSEKKKQRKMRKIC